VFTGGAGPPPELVKKLFDGPAKGALTVAADSGLELAEAAGLRPGWVLGDMDSLDRLSRLEKYPPDRVIRHRADKDYTDTELAFSLLAEKGCGEIWILGGGGGRIDHLFGISYLFERERFPSRWISAAADIYGIEGGGKRAPALLELESAAGALVSVFPVAGGPWRAASRGLKWPLDNLVWNRGFFGLSNIALSGACSIKAERGRFLVILPRGDE
jgi:thiamine pyrophosphokinase